jgi:hypothetical protein
VAVTFAVSKVTRATSALKNPAQTGALDVHGHRVEAMGTNAPECIPTGTHGLVAAVHSAYSQHYPLVLTPDMIWLAIAQGFADHVNANAERLRSKFVRHQGRVNLQVRRDDFIKGSRDNPWPEVFAEFSEQIAAHIGKQRDLVVCDFSTTGPHERAASEIVLLNAMKSFFSYEFQTLCGIPEITLEGTIEDWQSIRRRVQALEEYDLSWWTTFLGPVIDQFVATAKGRPDKLFWETLYKHEGGSGGPYVGGWINVFFPYLLAHEAATPERNDRLEAWQHSFDPNQHRAITMARIPSGVSAVPFKWQYLGESLAMELLSGFVGISQDARTLAVRPAIGWAVRQGADVEAQQQTVEAQKRQRDAEMVKTWVIGWQASGQNPKMIAGWCVEGKVTIEELRDLVVRLEQCGKSSNVCIDCIPRTKIEHSTIQFDKRYSIVFWVGVFVAQTSSGGSVQLRVEEMRRKLAIANDLAPAIQRELTASKCRYFFQSPQLYVLHGAVEIRSRQGDRGFRTPLDERFGELDISANAHDGRVAFARAQGFEDDSILYQLCAAKGRDI